MTQYVYEGTEVKLTGRRAEKRLERAGKPPKVIGILVEISPTDPDGPQWKKWVEESSLFKIIQ
jgi:hypothetical protein